MQSVFSAKTLAYTALFAALCCIGTVVIAIPLPFGYFNVGDVFVLLAGWCLGPIYGPIAAGVGSALADVISSYPIYAPATFVIKALNALIAYLVYTLIKKSIKNQKCLLALRFLSAALAECWMVVAYFLYESILYGFAAATGTMFGNGMQAIFCTILSGTLVSILYPIKTIRQQFPQL